VVAAVHPKLLDTAKCFLGRIAPTWGGTVHTACQRACSTRMSLPGRFKQSYDADAQHPVSKQLPKFGVEHPPPRALLGNEGGGCDGGVSGGGGGSTSQRPGHNHSWPWSPHGVAAGKHWANAIPGRLRHTNVA